MRAIEGTSKSMAGLEITSSFLVAISRIGSQNYYKNVLSTMCFVGGKSLFLSGIC
jgi:hypothetical protein